MRLLSVLFTTRQISRRLDAVKQFVNWLPETKTAEGPNASENQPLTCLRDLSVPTVNGV